MTSCSVAKIKNQKNQMLCKRHNQKAYFLCVESKCQLPVLICNQCIQDDHAHMSIPIKKLRMMSQQRMKKHQETDEMTNKIDSFYEDFKESIIKAIEDDQVQFVKQVWIKQTETLSKNVATALEKIKQDNFEELTSEVIRQTISALEKQSSPSPHFQQIIASQLSARKLIFDNIKNQLLGSVSLNSSWQFITIQGKKVRKGDLYCLESDSDLRGNQPLNHQKHRWKITFKNFDKFSCIGFGVTNYNLLNKHDVSLNSIICCICCNGPWSGRAVQPVQQYFLKNKLNEQNNSIILELNKQTKVFSIFEQDGRLFAKADISWEPFVPLVPIVKNTGNSGIQFYLQTLS